MQLKAVVDDLGGLFQHYCIYSPKITVCVTRGTCVLNKGTATGRGGGIVPSTKLVWCQTRSEVFRSSAKPPQQQDRS